MSIQRVAIKDFVSDLKAAEKRRDGYIMGSRGQDPKKWAKNSWWFTQYTGAQKRVLGVAHKGDMLEYGGEDSAGGWHKVNYKGKTGWVSGKYSEVG